MYRYEVSQRRPMRAGMGINDRWTPPHDHAAISAAHTTVRSAITVSRWRLAITAAIFALAGCASLGPTQLGPDRSRYGEAIATSWRAQMILNVVKLRYLDTPVYLDISSVISSYTRSAELNLSATLASGESGNSSRGAGATGSISESPTISYEPLSGDRLSNTLLRPIPPETLLGLVISGGQADFLLRATLQSINGIRNVGTSVARGRPGDPRFNELRQLLARLAQAGALSLRLETTKDDLTETWLGFDDGEDVAADVTRVKFLLGLQPDLNEFHVVFGVRRHASTEIAMLTRSLQAVIGDLASGVEVPPEDIAAGRATAPVARVGVDNADRLLRIRSGPIRPAGPSPAVLYRDRWYWVDDQDITSKRTLMFLFMFIALVQSDSAPQRPLLTIPAH